MTKLQLSIKANHGLDQCIYNAPTILQVAATWIENNNPVNYTKYDIIVQSKSQGLQIVSELSSCYNPMQYLLLFFKKNYSWHPEILQTMMQKKVTILFVQIALL
ncbi:4050_t:CDS:1 [Dentiscutata erythropus]|uniref:4050_t:CDS:1 n=1 Tax=Dentiscutata erythropus TaxID=1348616 RepID=A0A9N9G0X9_9GLOM|nr:4050_t:CDS:1 [Dentiscutata erythropus]